MSTNSGVQKGIKYFGNLYLFVVFLDGQYCGNVEKNISGFNTILPFLRAVAQVEPTRGPQMLIRRNISQGKGRSRILSVSNMPGNQHSHEKLKVTIKYSHVNQLVVFVFCIVLFTRLLLFDLDLYTYLLNSLVFYRAQWNKNPVK